MSLFDENLRGEITIVISEKKYNKYISNILSESDKKKINMYINKLSVKEIVNLVSERGDESKKDIYNYCLKIKKWKLI